MIKDVYKRQVYQVSEYTGWKTIGILPDKEISKSIMPLQTGTAVAAVLGICLLYTSNAKIPTIEEAAICCASCRPKRLKIGAMGMAIHLAMGV